MPGTTIQYKRLRSKNIIRGLSKPVDVINLSKSGLSFHIQEKLKTGESLIMKIKFPDGNNLKLKGHIRWKLPEPTDSLYSIGIQFFPFGSSNHYNPMPALDYLRSMDHQDIIHLQKN